MPKVGPRYAQDMPKICSSYAQDMPKKCQRYAPDMPKICRKYSQNMPKKCPNMPEICPRYAQDMPKICPKYARDMLEICPRYVQDMPEKDAKKWGKCLGTQCPLFLRKLGQNVSGAKCPSDKMSLSRFFSSIVGLCCRCQKHFGWTCGPFQSTLFFRFSLNRRFFGNF